jgi:hypothetical protein
MHHTCTYTLPVILQPHTCYKHRNYCKHSTTLFPVLLQAVLFSAFFCQSWDVVTEFSTVLDEPRVYLSAAQGTVFAR